MREIFIKLYTKAKFMAVSLEKAVIARCDKFGKRFEILVDPEKAVELKSGKNIYIADILAVEDVFEDAKKGMRASREDMRKVFGTENVLEVAEIIIKRGEVQITAEQRRKMIEEKKRLIATIISRESINPQTNTPHPVERILNAMELAKVNIDLYKSAEEQVNDVMLAIQRVLPIRFERICLQIKIPPAYSGKCYGVVKELGRMKREEWLADGSFFCVIEIPAGIQAEVFDKLNKLTNGEVVITQKEG